MKLIDNWRQSYKFYSVWVGIFIMTLSIADAVLRFNGAAAPAWLYWLTGPGVLIARAVQQFSEDD